MCQSISFKRFTDLPVVIGRGLGIGRFKAKVFGRPDGEVIEEGDPSLDGVIVSTLGREALESHPS